MALDTGFKIQGVTPARRKTYEKNLFYVGLTSSADGGSTGILTTAPYRLLLSACSTENFITNYSTRIDFIHMYFQATCNASSFYLTYTNIDTTTYTWSMIISTAECAANTAYNWVIPLPGRTKVEAIANTGTSDAYFNLFSAEAFGDQIFGNK